MMKHRLQVLAIGALAWLSANASATPGTTVITHGYQFFGDLPQWVHTMAEAVLKRAFVPDSGTVPTILRYDPLTGQWLYVEGGLDIDDELILVFDWSQESNWFPLANRKGTAAAAADALLAALRDPVLPMGLTGESLLGSPGPAQRRLHFIGHSRGAIVNSEVVRRLILDGYHVDQVTSLDPHPVDGSPDIPDLLDPQPKTWLGVEWADNYWRADVLPDPLDFSGQEVSGAYNLNLSLLKDFDACSPPEGVCNCEHVKVHAWYHGTIDLAAVTDGECAIERDEWYPDGDASEQGYYFSQIGGGAGDRGSNEGSPPPSSGFGPPRPVPAQASILINGDFGFGAGEPAGWFYHGGDIDGDGIVEEDGEIFLKLGEGFGLLATHNRFHLPADTDTLVFDYKIIAGGEGQFLNIFFSDEGNLPSLEMIPLDAPGEWVIGHSICCVAFPQACLVASKVAVEALGHVVMQAFRSGATPMDCGTEQ